MDTFPLDKKFEEKIAELEVRITNSEFNLEFLLVRLNTWSPNTGVTRDFLINSYKELSEKNEADKTWLKRLQNIRTIVPQGLHIPMETNNSLGVSQEQRPSENERGSGSGK